jgi:hypothetical protein
VAFNGCCIDKRIRAAVPMSGLRLPFGASTFFPAGDDTPVLIIHGAGCGGLNRLPSAPLELSEVA